jgi:hypothetical protein
MVAAAADALGQLLRAIDAAAIHATTTIAANIVNATTTITANAINAAAAVTIG